MLHPAASAVETYFTLFNEKKWSTIATMFDVPTTILFGPTKIVLEKQDDVTALYRGLEEKFAKEGVNHISWDLGNFSVFLIHDDLATVKATVTRHAVNGTPIKTWNCSYTLRLIEQQWRFTLVTSDDVGNAEASRLAT